MSEKDRILRIIGDYCAEVLENYDLDQNAIRGDLAIAKEQFTAAIESGNTNAAKELNRKLIEIASRNGEVLGAANTLRDLVSAIKDAE